MDVEWATIFYIISSLSMLVVLLLAAYVFIIVRRIQARLEQGARTAVIVTSIAKISLLKGLLKIFR